MPAMRIKTRSAIAVSVAIAAFGVVTVAQARVIGDPPVNAKRTQPVRGKTKKKITTTRLDSGYPCCSGVWVHSAAEARTE
jgi:hypothetical protein